MGYILSGHLVHPLALIWRAAYTTAGARRDELVYKICIMSDEFSAFLVANVPER